MIKHLKMYVLSLLMGKVHEDVGVPTADNQVSEEVGVPAIDDQSSQEVDVPLIDG
jgi:hypothetical protein